MLCADGVIRQCYPIISAITADYEEQVVITGVKSLRHCCVCRVHPNERETLCPVQPWEFRTHEWTQQQIGRQSTPEGHEEYPEGHPDRVDPLANWAWLHQYLNIHTTLTPDNLHMLYKGVVKHLDQWDRGEIGAHIKPRKLKRAGIKTLLQSNSTMQLDQRFRIVPPFQGLKRWKHYSLVSQWTGAEYRSLCKQLIPVIAPLLSKVSVGAMHCTRAIMDFVMLARYASHTEETLRYMEHALFRIDKTKGALREHRPTKAFNFPKWHAMSHYTYFIRRYGAAIGFDTAISETEHIEQVKNFYARTNKKDFEVQILRHNTRDLKMRALRDLHLYKNGYIALRANHDAKPQVNRVAQATNHGPKGMNWPKSQAEKQEIRSNRKKTNHWCYASTLAQEIKLSDLLDALAVFVRERRKQGTSEELDPTRREPDPSWVAKYLVQLHPSITTWKKTGKNPRDLDELTEEKLYCCPNWQRRGHGWRNDCVWV